MDECYICERSDAARACQYMNRVMTAAGCQWQVQPATGARYDSLTLMGHQSKLRQSCTRPQSAEVYGPLSLEAGGCGRAHARHRRRPSRRLACAAHAAAMVERQRISLCENAAKCFSLATTPRATARSSQASQGTFIITRTGRASSAARGSARGGHLRFQSIKNVTKGPNRG